MAQRTNPVREPLTFWYTLARVLLFIFMPFVYPVRYHDKARANEADAPFMLVCNHGSMIDPLTIVLPIKRYEVRFLGKRELTGNPILAYVLGKLHMITVSRHMTDMAAMRACNDVLKQGHVLGIFPEGTRKAPSELMQTVESGVALIALRNRVPVMPVYIHQKMRPFRLNHIYYMPPLDYSHLKDRGVGKDMCDAFTALLTQTYLDFRATVESAPKRV